MEKRGAGKELPLQTQDTSGQMQLFLTSFLLHSLVWWLILMIVYTLNQIAFHVVHQLYVNSHEKAVEV